MVETKRGPKIEGVEINGENLLEQIRFSANGRGPEVAGELIFNKRLTGADIVGAIKSCVIEGSSINSRVALKALKQTPCTAEQLGDVVKACTEGLLETRQKQADWHSTVLPEMAQYRHLRREALDMFDVAVNQRPVISS